MDNLNKPNKQIYTYIQNGDTAKLAEQLDLNEPLFLDTETHKQFRQIVLIQLYQMHWSKVLIFKILNTNILKKIYDLIKDAHIIAHNYAYDASTLCNDLNIPADPFSRWDDTFYLSKCRFYTEEHFDLESVMKLVLGYSPYEIVGIDKKKAQMYFLNKDILTNSLLGGLGGIDEKMLLYSAIDVFYLPRVWIALGQYTHTWHYRVDKQFISNLLKWQQFGMPIDKSILADEISKVKRELAEQEKQLGSLNYNSPKQVCSALRIKSSSKDELSDLILNSTDAKKVNLAKLIIAARHSSKTLNFLERYSHSRIRGYFAPSTKSGRVKCDGTDFSTAEMGEDNLLQVPRHLKRVFGYSNNNDTAESVSDKSDKYFIYCDYAQLELRSACALLGEKALFDCFEAGRDLHSHTAELMFGVPYDDIKTLYKDKRQSAKRCNFALLYCASAQTLQNVFLNDGTNTPLDEITQIRSLWKKAYKSISAWHDLANDRYEASKLSGEPIIMTTPNGRRYVPKLFTDLCGIENQSLGADAAKMALNIFCKVEPSAKVLCFIHDAIVLEADSAEEATRLAKQLGDAMVLGWFYAIKHLKYPRLSMPLEVGICKNLNDAESKIVYTTEGKFTDYFTNEGAQMVFEENLIQSQTAYPKIAKMILDADYLVYVAALEAEKADLSQQETLDLLISRIAAMKDAYGIEDWLICLTGQNVFRYDIYADYKANRKNAPKPRYISYLKDQLCEFDNVIRVDSVEADDLCSYYRRTLNSDWVVASNDKDVLHGIPSLSCDGAEVKHFDLYHFNFVQTSELDAQKFKFFQCLAGDASDNIKGVAKIGKVKAEQILADCESEAQCCAVAEDAYLAAGMSEEDLLLNYRLVNLEQFDGKKINLADLPQHF